jgi:hypothetical protein
VSTDFGMDGGRLLAVACRRDWVERHIGAVVVTISGSRATSYASNAVSKTSFAKSSMLSELSKYT